MTYDIITEAHRSRLIADLRGMADFLDMNPQLPVPRYGSVRVSVHPRYDTDALTEAEALAEVERIAALLGVPIRAKNGHHIACVDFGLVSYEAVLITQTAMDRADARDSYRHSMSTDPPSGA
ncbi:hypothetical protein FXF51_42695 [Nonomuraea sp. PA05]|uniref:hypothetical protein n=1 Tax=Nonomuraea sp. PA05 TaxID=2604466 RepID=UPI0011D6F322|nr:hypothetical protein [Nonomuraea sp. PA05]TYB56818.1 hypothetical protein FXF51_42695 [Nonomuraea sp. PA05]